MRGSRTRRFHVDVLQIFILSPAACLPTELLKKIQLCFATFKAVERVKKT